MEAKCHNCQKINILSPETVAQGRFFCVHCGATNILPPIDESTQYTDYSTEATRMDMNGAMRPGGYGPQVPPAAPQGGGYGPQYPPPAPRTNSNSSNTVVWLIIALVVVVLGLGIWYYISHRPGSSEAEMEQAELANGSGQEDFIRDFYTDCVFGEPHVSEIKAALTEHLLNEVGEGGNKYALYKFATSHSKGKSDESRVTDVVEVEDGVYRVDYIDRGYEASSNVYLAKTDDGWKIDRVEFLREEKAEKDEPKEVTTTVTSHTYEYEGYVSQTDYPVTGKLTFTPQGSGYKITGKYAYYSTLKKYGDKSTSWINVDGYLDANGNFSWDENIVGNSEFHSHVTGSIEPDRSSITGYNEEGHYHCFRR